MPPITLQTNGLCPCASIHGWKWSEIIANVKPASSARRASAIRSAGPCSSDDSQYPNSVMSPVVPRRPPRETRDYFSRRSGIVVVGPALPARSTAVIFTAPVMPAPRERDARLRRRQEPRADADAIAEDAAAVAGRRPAQRDALSQLAHDDGGHRAGGTVSRMSRPFPSTMPRPAVKRSDTSWLIRPTGSTARTA